MSDGAQQLRERASELLSLATDVRDLLSGQARPLGYVQHSMQSWEGPNRDEVSGQLDTYHRECSAAADILEGLARSLQSQADQADQADENGDGDP